jgi:hypothetical protein
MDSGRAPQEQQQGAPKEQNRPKRFSPNWAKEKYKAYTEKARIGCKEWFQRPWWFQEQDPLAKFTGWVAIYTGILVLVSALQFCTLQSTDRTTHEALIAANRAWIGPTATTVPSLPNGQGFDVTVQYQNTGRQPAFNLVIAHVIKTYSKNEWGNGAVGIAATQIIANGQSCLKIKKLIEHTQVAYPSSGLTGSGYSMRIDTNNPTEQNKVLADADISSGNKIFVVQWCFIYLSLTEVHHSTACYFYQAKVSTLPNLNICQTGNDAD